MTDFQDFMQRFSQIMLDPGELAEDGTVQLSDAFTRLRADLDAALATSKNADELQELVRMMDEMAALLANPDLAGTMLDSMSRASEPQPDIFAAIDSEDVEEVRAALDHCDVNARYGEFEATALYHAMSSMGIRSLDIITLLIDEGADPQLGLTDSNVLHGLGFGNQTGIPPEDLSRIIRRCVELGADLEQRTSKLQWTPLITAVSEWNEVATEALLLAGADISARAGEVDGACFAGSDSFAFADGHEPTMQVLRRYQTKQ